MEFGNGDSPANLVHLVGLPEDVRGCRGIEKFQEVDKYRGAIFQSGANEGVRGKRPGTIDKYRGAIFPGERGGPGKRPETIDKYRGAIFPRRRK